MADYKAVVRRVQGATIAGRKYMSFEITETGWPDPLTDGSAVQWCISGLPLYFCVTNFASRIAKSDGTTHETGKMKPGLGSQSSFAEAQSGALAPMEGDGLLVQNAEFESVVNNSGTVNVASECGSLHGAMFPDSDLIEELRDETNDDAPIKVVTRITIVEGHMAWSAGPGWDGGFTSPLNGKGQILSHNGTAEGVLGQSATNGHVLTADDNASLGIKWAAIDNLLPPPVYQGAVLVVQDGQWVPVVPDPVGQGLTLVSNGGVVSWSD